MQGTDNIEAGGHAKAIARRGRPLKGGNGRERVATSLSLTGLGKQRLEWLARTMGLSQKGVIEVLIDNEARRRGFAISAVPEPTCEAEMSR